MEVTLTTSYNVQQLAAQGGIKTSKKRAATKQQQGCSINGSTDQHDTVRAGRSASSEDRPYECVSPTVLKPVEVDGCRGGGIVARFMIAEALDKCSNEEEEEGEEQREENAHYSGSYCDSSKDSNATVSTSNHGTRASLHKKRERLLELVIGRDPAHCDAIIDMKLSRGPLLSRNHCVLCLRLTPLTSVLEDTHGIGGNGNSSTALASFTSHASSYGLCEMYVRDLGSLNGTCVDGRRIAKKGCSESFPFHPLLSLPSSGSRSSDSAVSDGREPLLTLSFGAGGRLGVGEEITDSQLQLRLQVYVRAVWPRKLPSLPLLPPHSIPLLCTIPEELRESRVRWLVHAFFKRTGSSQRQQQLAMIKDIREETIEPSDARLTDTSKEATGRKFDKSDVASEAEGGGDSALAHQHANRDFDDAGRLACSPIAKPIDKDMSISNASGGGDGDTSDRIKEYWRPTDDAVRAIIEQHSAVRSSGMRVVAASLSLAVEAPTTNIFPSTPPPLRHSDDAQGNYDGVVESQESPPNATPLTPCEEDEPLLLVRRSGDRGEGANSSHVKRQKAAGYYTDDAEETTSAAANGASKSGKAARWSTMTPLRVVSSDVLEQFDNKLESRESNIHSHLHDKDRHCRHSHHHYHRFEVSPQPDLKTLSPPLSQVLVAEHDEANLGYSASRTALPRRRRTGNARDSCGGDTVAVAHTLFSSKRPRTGSSSAHCRHRHHPTNPLLLLSPRSSSSSCSSSTSSLRCKVAASPSVSFANGTASELMQQQQQSGKIPLQGRSGGGDDGAPADRKRRRKQQTSADAAETLVRYLNDVLGLKVPASSITAATTGDISGTTTNAFDKVEAMRESTRDDPSQVLRQDRQETHTHMHEGKEEEERMSIELLPRARRGAATQAPEQGEDCGAGRRPSFEQHHILESQEDDEEDVTLQSFLQLAIKPATGQEDAQAEGSAGYGNHFSFHTECEKEGEIEAAATAETGVSQYQRPSRVSNASTTVLSPRNTIEALQRACPERMAGSRRKLKNGEAVSRIKQEDADASDVKEKGGPHRITTDAAATPKQDLVNWFGTQSQLVLIPTQHPLCPSPDGSYHHSSQEAGPVSQHSDVYSSLLGEMERHGWHTAAESVKAITTHDGLSSSTTQRQQQRQRRRVDTRGRRLDPILRSRCSTYHFPPSLAVQPSRLNAAVVPSTSETTATDSDIAMRSRERKKMQNPATLMQPPRQVKERQPRRCVARELLGPHRQQSQVEGGGYKLDSSFTTATSRLLNPNRHDTSAMSFFARVEVARLLRRHQWDAMRFIWQHLIDCDSGDASDVNVEGPAAAAVHVGAGARTRQRKARRAGAMALAEEKLRAGRNSGDKLKAGSSRIARSALQLKGEGDVAVDGDDDIACSSSSSFELLDPLALFTQREEVGVEGEEKWGEGIHKGSAPEGEGQDNIHEGRGRRSSGGEKDLSRGCVLAHAAGLGKTLIVAAFLLTLWLYRRTCLSSSVLTPASPTTLPRPPPPSSDIPPLLATAHTRSCRVGAVHTVICVPRALLYQWARELGKCATRACEEAPITVFALDTPKRKGKDYRGVRETLELLQRWRDAGEDRTVLLTTHAMMSSIMKTVESEVVVRREKRIEERVVRLGTPSLRTSRTHASSSQRFCQCDSSGSNNNGSNRSDIMEGEEAVEDDEEEKDVMKDTKHHPSPRHHCHHHSKGLRHSTTKRRANEEESYWAEEESSDGDSSSDAVGGRSDVEGVVADGQALLPQREEEALLGDDALLGEIDDMEDPPASGIAALMSRRKRGSTSIEEEIAMDSTCATPALRTRGSMKKVEGRELHLNQEYRAASREILLSHTTLLIVDEAGRMRHSRTSLSTVLEAFPQEVMRVALLDDDAELLLKGAGFASLFTPEAPSSSTVNNISSLVRRQCRDVLYAVLHFASPCLWRSRANLTTMLSSTSRSRKGGVPFSTAGNGVIVNSCSMANDRASGAMILLPSRTVVHSSSLFSTSAEVDIRMHEERYRRLAPLRQTLHVRVYEDVLDDLPHLIETCLVFDMSPSQCSMFRELVHCCCGASADVNEFSPSPSPSGSAAIPASAAAAVAPIDIFSSQAFASRVLMLTTHSELVRDWLRLQGVDASWTTHDIDVYEGRRSHRRTGVAATARGRQLDGGSVRWALPSLLIPSIFSSCLVSIHCGAGRPVHGDPSSHASSSDDEDNSDHDHSSNSSSLAPRQHPLETLEHAWKLKGVYLLLHAALSCGEKVVVCSHSVKSLVLIGALLQCSSGTGNCSTPSESCGCVDGEDFVLMSATLTSARVEELCGRFNDKASSLCIVLLPLLPGSGSPGFDLHGADRLILLDIGDNSAKGSGVGTQGEPSPLELRAIGRMFCIHADNNAADEEDERRGGESKEKVNAQGEFHSASRCYASSSSASTPAAAGARRTVYVNRVLANEPLELLTICAEAVADDGGALLRADMNVCGFTSHACSATALIARQLPREMARKRRLALGHTTGHPHKKRARETLPRNSFGGALLRHRAGSLSVSRSISPVPGQLQERTCGLPRLPSRSERSLTSPSTLSPLPPPNTTTIPSAPAPPRSATSCMMQYVSLTEVRRKGRVKALVQQQEQRRHEGGGAEVDPSGAKKDSRAGYAVEDEGETAASADPVVRVLCESKLDFLAGCFREYRVLSR